MSGPEKIVRETFERDANAYLAAYRKQEGARSVPFLQREKTVKEMFPWKGARTLDVGGGPGIFTGWLLDRGCQVCTIDIAKEMIRLAAISVHDHPDRDQSFFIIGSAENLPFGGKSFDAVLCIGLIEYVDNLDHALKELARVISSGGGLIVSGPNANSMISRIDRLAARIINFLFGPALVFLRGRKFFDYPFPHRTFDPRELAGKLEGLGFRLSEQRFTNFRSRIIRWPLTGLADRTALWMEKTLTGGRFQQLGTNFIARFDRL